jgi:hypothetical protein
MTPFAFFFRFLLMTPFAFLTPFAFSFDPFRFLLLTLMKSRLLLNTRSLKRSFAFYSALGITWLAGEDRAQDIPDVEEAEMGLPNLWGQMGDLELMFYSAPNASPATGAAATLLVSYQDDAEILAVLEKLNAVGLLAKHSDFDGQTQRKLFDPDGRLVELIGPSPFDP